MVTKKRVSIYNPPAVSCMHRAIELAAQGGGWVNPNPQVGAVIFKDERIIGEGYHERFGGPHAERNAIADALKRGETLQGATMCVTLEPCCHTGKTPPCTDAIIEQGITGVLVGSPDPNPQVAGKGIAQLRAAGIEVGTDFLRTGCDKLNQIFFHYIQTKTPYVLMKYAMTLDGKIATHTGASKWITGESARADVHRLRGRFAAIMVGIGTVLTDDPLLNCRLEGGHNPLRVICDSRLQIPLTSQIVQTAAELPTLIATCSTDGEKAAQLREHGCDVLAIPAGNGLENKRVDLRILVNMLGERGIDSVLIEGGATLHAAALESGIVNRARCYVAPKFFGGASAPSPIGGVGVATPDEAFYLTNT
ncbi:MAG: bifunctional diaminohydroxyphosphoribosylaminopyrimidine deaminase/5-amino-6-(5-phosphoribosylamino)uracil reductase RibD, partial [Coriobacteriia bacterium]|nr:bifunctional diaminohydroxyphosphoribosylaminopyrimidine deaminase/5-amino-6-(5-phosphoribosylamino)uracil reductase RibD [Coriobacteriia bacterium]